MDSILEANVNAKLVIGVVIVLILLWVAWQKYGESIKATINHGDIVNHEIQKLKEWKVSVDEKLERDYSALKRLEKETEDQDKRITDSLEEREIIMRATLATLKGLQELGANGETKTSQKEIEDYLTRKAHR